MTRLITSFEDIAHKYDAVLFDVWGCLHNGLKPYPKAVAALQKYIAGGGRVVLLTNSPRPGHETTKQINSIGVPRNSWNVIVTSGDAAQHALFSGHVGTRVYHIGTDAELSFFQKGPNANLFCAIDRVPLNEAEGMVCTGPFKESLDKPEDYRLDLQEALSRKLTLLCANPDLMVYRGHRKVLCAGAIAQEYAQIGGKVLLFGKPREAIYTLAMSRLEQLLPTVDKRRILCVGDGIPTDVLGAIQNDFPCLFVTGGLAVEETGTKDEPNPDMLKSYLHTCGLNPDYAIGHFG